MTSIAIRNIHWKRIASLGFVILSVTLLIIIMKFQYITFLGDNQIISSYCGIREFSYSFPFTLIKERIFVDNNSIYTNYTNSFASFGRFVYLDLFRVPPKLDYLTQLISFLRNSGATGLIIEYGDRFPYRASLSDLSSQQAFKY
jgi:hypothetical protein